ncbi:MAG: 3-ketoacyl-ACP reductase [Fimbriimonadaceae bacterium]|nr:3-ketoacyl-ACP reductase [Fimbriimonadaceae bacterium]
MSERRVALVTGASRGIGRGIAEALGAAGWAVVVNYHSSPTAAEECAAAIDAAGGASLLVQADIANLADHDRLLALTLERFGRVDLLVNNAGVAPTVRTDLLQATPESFDRVMGINLRGPYFLTQRVAQAMVAGLDPSQPAPQIINIGSVSAYAASTFRGEYCLSKAALGMMTALFADRLAEHGIRVYEIRPGVIESDMTGPVKAKYDQLIADGLSPIRRWGTPGDIAAAVLAIADGAFPFSTGLILDVDGGFHVRRL